MGPVTIVFGVLLVVLGLVAYFTGTPNPEVGHVSYTALIPAFVGLPLLLLGVVALKERFRKHAMHAAATLGLIGFLVPVVRMVLVLTTSYADGSMIERLLSRPFVIQGLMALICAVFVGLCVRSFVVARMNRAKQATTPEGNR